MKRSRLLYRGTPEDGHRDDARYEIEHTPGEGEVALRIWDVVGGDVLVFLTPGRVRRLIADLLPHVGAPRRKRARRSRP